ncbi:MAG: DUF1207 domain-containing protein [Gemmatimonadota bacterium]
MLRARGLLVLACVVALVMVPGGAGAQEVKRLFAPLLADPKQPHFFAAWLWVKSPTVTGTVANVGLGEDVAFASGRNRRWEISVAAGVFSQFNLGTRSIDLINTDFTIGFPLAYRAGAGSLRLKLYHQSSHLGDEFILNTNPTRVNLSFEAVELLASRDFGEVRAYGGGEYIVRHEPADLKPGLLHAGVEFRPTSPGPGSGRLIAAIDAKSSQEREWRVGWSGRVGIEFRVPMQGTTVRRFSLQLHGYTGPAPYGQFYQENVRSLGAGIHLAL